MRTERPSIRSGPATRSASRMRGAVTALVAGGAAALSGGAWAQASEPAAAAEPTERTLVIGGYLRGWVSMNLQDQPETFDDDKYKLSMIRGSLLLDADWKPVSIARFKAIARLDKEAGTNYLDSLEEPPSQKPPGSTAAVFSTRAGGNVGSLRTFYDRNELREWWGAVDLGERVKFKFGRQQVVWGETDFFRALDLVHGFDYTWRSFLEPENEELRKPLILARMQIQVPEAKGSFDLFVRPGWDSDEDIGNTFDLAGGRWASQPARGASFLYATGYNLDTKGGDADDVTGGIRWQGIAGPINYSIAYLRTFNADPVANPCPETLAALYGGAPIPAADPANYTTFKQRPVNCGFDGPGPFGNPLQFGDWIHPTTDILGVTASGYVPAIDAVISTEIAYQKDRSYNYGLADGGRFGTNITPGAFGIIQKDVLITMFRIDKQLDLSRFIGTSRPSFASIQLFNTRILNFDRDDEIVQLAYWKRARSANSALLTGILAMNYDNDRVNPSLAAGWDVNYGGGFVIPSVEWVIGDNWRLKAELDLFWDAGNEKKRYLNPETGQFEEQGKGASLFGYFSGSNQALIRVTRQF